MANKSSHKKSKNSDSVPVTIIWYKNSSLIVSIFSIIAATLVGILSIINSRAIAHLDKDVYVPKLAYRIGQEEIGKIYIEIINQGSVSAKNVILTLDWNVVEIKDCASQPPFQNSQPVQPIVPKNLTFKADSLFPGGTYKIICNIDVPYSIIDNSTSNGTPVVNSLSDSKVYIVTGTPAAELLSSLYNNSEKMDTAHIVGTIQPEEVIPVKFDLMISTTIELDLQSDFIRANAIAENSLPAIEIGRPQKIRLLFVFPTPTANPTP